MNDRIPFLERLRSDLLSEKAWVKHRSRSLYPKWLHSHRKILVGMASFVATLVIGLSSYLLFNEPSPQQPAPADVGPVADDGSALPLCDDTSWPTPRSAGSTQTTPTIHDAQSVMEEVTAFASTLPGFEAAWLHRDGPRTSIAVGFVGADIAAHQAELETEFSDVGIQAVEMPIAANDLHTKRAWLEERLPDGMHIVRVDEIAGYIQVWAEKSSAEERAQLQQFGTEAPICLYTHTEDQDDLASSAPIEGSRHLGEFEASLGLSPRVAASSDELNEFWAQLGTDVVPLPEVDFGSEVVFFFDVGQGCNQTSFEGVSVTDDVLHPTMVPDEPPTEPELCLPVRISRTLVIALDRTSLTAPPLTVRSHPEESIETVIEADLRPHGSTAASSEIHYDLFDGNS